MQYVWHPCKYFLFNKKNDIEFISFIKNIYIKNKGDKIQ